MDPIQIATLKCFACGASTGRTVVKVIIYTTGEKKTGDFVTVCSSCKSDRRVTHTRVDLTITTLPIMYKDGDGNDVNVEIVEKPS